MRPKWARSSRKSPGGAPCKLALSARCPQKETSSISLRRSTTSTRGRTSAMRTRRLWRTCSRAGTACWATTRSSSPARTSTGRRSSARPRRPASPPQQFADEVSRTLSRALWDRMGLTYDKFIRTTDAEHKRGVQKLFTHALRARLHLSRLLHGLILRER